MTRQFLDQHAWATLEAAMARIIPSDGDPGAREAGTVVFLDRYLAGTESIYSDPSGDEFLALDERRAGAWHRRVQRLRELYRAGVAELDCRARQLGGSPFHALAKADQDRVLAALELDELGPPETRPLLMQRPVSDGDLGFLQTLVLHTRQGFYSDPAYGGNRNRAGWALVGFPGPRTVTPNQGDEHGRD
jgi:gluconate 2-dehydrogenase gamma chain